MIGFSLAENLISCPKAWQNFITEAQEFFWQDIAVQRINDMLKTYGGRYRFPHHEGDQPFIEFETEAGLLMFMLKWS